MKLNGLSFIGTLLLIISGLNSCSEPVSAPLRLGTNRWPGYEPLYLARELGLVQDANIRLVEYPSGTEAMYAMRNNSIDMAALTLDEALVLIQDGVKINIVLIMDFSAGADAVVGKPEIKNLSQLAGKRIAYESAAVGAIMIDALLTKAGLSTDQVILVNRTANHHFQAYQQNEADVIVTFEPVLSQLLAMGGHRLFDSKAIPGRIVDVLVIRSEIMEKHIADLKQLINAWFKALTLIQTEPAKVMPVLAKRLGLTVQQMQDAYEGLELPDREINKTYFLSSNKLKNQAESLQQLMLQRGLLQQQVNLDTVFNGKAL